MAHPKNGTPTIILPQTPISVMPFDEIEGRDNIEKIVKEIESYIVQRNQSGCIQKETNESKETNEPKETEELDEDTKQKCGLLHPNKLAGMDIKFSTISTVSSSTILKEMYEHGSLIVYKEHSPKQRHRIGIVFSPQKIKTFTKASRSQFNKTLLAYFEFVLESYTFVKTYQYPYKEIFGTKYHNEVALNMSVFFVYSKEDYMLFNTKKSYEQYLFESFKLKPCSIFNVSKEYTYNQYYSYYNSSNLDKFHKGILSAIKKAMKDDLIEYLDHLERLRKIAKNESSMIKNEQEFHMEHTIHIHEIDGIAIQMDQFSKKE